MPTGNYIGNAIGSNLVIPYWKQHFPSDLVIDIISDARIDLSWINNGSPTWSYTIIERSLNSYTWFEIGAVAPNVSTYTDTDVAAYTTTYYYRLRYVKVSASSDIPALVSATVENASPTKLRLIFDGILDYASIPATTDFTVTDHTITSVRVMGYTVTLILSTPVIYFDILKVGYTPGVNKLRIMNGGNAAAFSNQVIINNVTEDGNTVAWYDSTDLTTITKDANELVSVWADKMGTAAKNLIQNGVTSIRPLWSSTGILFDGSNDFMATGTFTLSRPSFVYMVVNNKSFTTNDVVCDGYGTSTGRIKQQTTGTTLLAFYAGDTEKFSIDAISANQKIIIRTLWNGVNSSIQINDHAIWNGGLGTIANMSGFTLARAGTSGSAYGNIEVQEVILRKTADSQELSDSIMNYLKTKYSVIL
jgi:hypothetical protein